MTECRKAILRFALISLIAAEATAASGEPIEARNRTRDDSVLVRMINAQIHVLEEYTRCVEGPGATAPCQPPRPLQLPPMQDAVQDQDVHGESMVDSAARTLKEAEMRAIKAHAKCERLKKSSRCGPPP
jgi:hypothetical protein